jgi:putative MATE family efflux protein
MHSKSQGTGLQTTLDTLEFGTDESANRNLTLSRKERKLLPDGVSSRNLYRDVLLIAGPSLAEMMLGSLVRMVDQMMVGTLGPNAISAVGLVLQPSFLLMSIVMAMNTGATAIIARARGANNQEKANDILRQTMVIGTALGIICTLIGGLGAEFMVKFMAGSEISEQTVDMAITYFKIQSWTYLIPSWSFSITAVLRGTGNSKPCMVYNIVANVVNVILNALMIDGVWHLGVAGAAWATAIGQLVGTVMAFGCIQNGKYYIKLKINLKNILKFDGETVRGMANVGVPAIIEQLFMRVGLVIYTKTVAGLGDIDFATYNICLGMQSLTMMNGQAFAVSATSLIGQSLGRKRLDMADHYGRICRNVAQVIAVLLAVTFFLIPKLLIGLFLSAPNASMSAAETAQRLADNAQVLLAGTAVMYVLAIMQPIQCAQFVVGGILRGAGDTKVTAVIVLITTVGLRTLLGYLFVTVFGLGLMGAWYALAIDQIARTALFSVRHAQGHWKRIRL